MERKNLVFIFVLISLSCLSCFYSESNLMTYTVHVKLPEAQTLSEPLDLESHYQSFLPETSLTSTGPSAHKIYSYNHVMTGFAAKLTPEHVKSMAKKEGFLFARPQRIFFSHTTHTPNFLGLHQNLGFWHDSNYGKGIIIGVLDSGIAPSHPSFHDKGLPPPPKKWKGRCEFEGFCNNKIIGARSFGNHSKEPPMDHDGHGTHCKYRCRKFCKSFKDFIINQVTNGTSHLVLFRVQGGNVYGEATGTAVGMAPLAHLAIYKVCFTDNCPEVDILAAMDVAVDDGVDIISISLGPDVSSPFHSDAISLGAFTAMKKGIFVSVSAGNAGPTSSSLLNEAPWYLTVGASTIDRSIRSTAVLGNKEQYNGETLFQPIEFPKKNMPLIYAGVNNFNSSFCTPGSFNNTDIKGKVVVCERGGNIVRTDKGLVVKEAGGVGMILLNRKVDGYSTLAEAHVLPAVQVSHADGLNIKEYINSTTNPTTSILFKGTVIGEAIAPAVTSFSSRGPNRQSPGILKPDIIGPGVSILAAWPFSVENKTDTTSTFNIISGTSMSCPHLSGIAALLKNAHPDWSPAAIKSAMMTTADLANHGNSFILDERLLSANFYALGAGHVNPSQAVNPGLIYDVNPDDYIPYLCGLNYTDDQVTVITSSKVNCSKVTNIPEAELNYPTFSVALGDVSLTYSRTVTNVGPANSSYRSFVVNPPGVEVTTKPQELRFSEINQKLTYEVTFNRLSDAPSNTFVEGYLSWSSSSAKHVVTSPISVILL